MSAEPHFLVLKKGEHGPLGTVTLFCDLGPPIAFPEAKWDELVALMWPKGPEWEGERHREMYRRVTKYLNIDISISDKSP